MSDSKKKEDRSQVTRRKFLAGLAAGAGALALPPADADARGIDEYFRQHYTRLSKDDLADILAKLEEELSFKYGKEVRGYQTWSQYYSGNPAQDQTIVCLLH